MSTGGTIHLSPVIKSLNYQYSLRDLFSPILEGEIIEKSLALYDAKTFDMICSTCPIKVSPYPVEVVARLSRKEKRRTSLIVSKKQESRSRERQLYKESIVPVEIRIHEYPLSTLCSEDPSRCLYVRSEVNPRTLKLPRSREDHKYRLFGEISTSYTKIIHILDVENITVSDSVICLAEGEGGLCRLLHMRGAELIYYNSKIETDKLVPQRGLGFVPACVSDLNTIVKWGDICALTGGYLTKEM